ncbi:hypothetical protein Tco_1029288 [Tanacetum coccineum]|uniref:Transposase (Putative), gypsy type n=1 Tax=Tanacetum coccineum TaxID=301880 RepID=A0ABQ5G4R8_9ASTR
MHAEFNIRDKRRLSNVVKEKNSLLKARDEEVASLKAQLLVKEAEATEAIHLRSKVQTLADRNTVLEGEKSKLDVKVADLAATVKVKEQDVADLDAMVASVTVHNDNLSYQVHTLEVSSAGLQEKVTAYENFIGQLEKFQDDRMREMNENFDNMDIDLVELALHLEDKFYPHLLTTIYGRRWLLTNGLELAITKCLNSIKKDYLLELPRVLTDVAAYNPSAEADYPSALQRLQSVNFYLVTKLKSNKDASFDTIINLLCLKDSLAERSALYDVFVPLSKPLSTIALMGTKVISATIDTPIDLSTTLAYASIITPISIEDYEVTGMDGQEAVNESVLNNATGGNVNPFPNVDDLKLNVSQ